MKFFLCLLLVVCTHSACEAQLIPSYDLGGASKPKPEMPVRKAKQYKRAHQIALRMILRGQTKQAEQFLADYQAKNGTDEETAFMLGILYGQTGRLKQAERALRSHPIDSGRAIAGPRTLIEPVADSEFLKNCRKFFQHRPVHGPLLGHMTDEFANFWVRTSAESDVKVTVFPPAFGEALESETVRTLASNDYTAVLKVHRLEANADYFYAIQIDGGRPDKGFPLHQWGYRFRAPPKSGQPAKFTIAFGGGAGYVPENERMWDTIGKFNPTSLLLLGDNVYIDDPESIAMQHYTYYRRQSRLNGGG